MSGVDVAYLALACAGSVVGSIGAVVVAARRNVHQPIDIDEASEDIVIDALQRDPAQWLRGRCELTRDDFSRVERQESFDQVVDQVERHLSGDERAQADAATREEDGDAMEHLVSVVRERVGGERLSSQEVATYLSAGGSVLSAAAGRAHTTPRSVIVQNSDSERPFERTATRVPVGRYITAAVFGAVIGVVAWSLAHHLDTYNTGGVLALVVGVGIGGVAVAYIDIDTLYLDTLTFAIWAVVSWGGLLLLVYTSGVGYSGVITGLIGAVSVAVGFELIARGWGRLRGLTQGAGDTWIAMVTAGVPAALCTDWRVAIWSILAGSVSVVLHWIVLAARGAATTQTPVPFGPHLVGGSGIALAVWMVMV